MDSMDIDQDAITPAKRKADEKPLHSTTPESKRFKLTEPFPQTPNTKTHNQEQTPDQNQDEEGHTSSTSPTASSPQNPSHKEVYRSALRDEFHTLNRRLVKKRDEFAEVAVYYESRVGLYEGLSEMVEEKGERTEFNDWIEHLSIKLLDAFMWMEGRKVEIEAIERRLYFILFELGGVV